MLLREVAVVLERAPVAVVAASLSQIESDTLQLQGLCEQWQALEVAKRACAAECSVAVINPATDVSADQLQALGWTKEPRKVIFQARQQARVYAALLRRVRRTNMIFRRLLTGIAAGSSASPPAQASETEPLRT